MGLELRVRSCLGYELLIRLAFFFFALLVVLSGTRGLMKWGWFPC